MKTKPLNKNLKTVGLHQPKGVTYRVLACVSPDCNPPYGCGDQWEIAIQADGQWVLQCMNCFDTAVMLSEVMSAVNK